jgi:hypothetical protein
MTIATKRFVLEEFADKVAAVCHWHRIGRTAININLEPWDALRAGKSEEQCFEWD